MSVIHDLRLRRRQSELEPPTHEGRACKPRNPRGGRGRPSVGRGAGGRAWRAMGEAVEVVENYEAHVAISEGFWRYTTHRSGPFRSCVTLT